MCLVVMYTLLNVLCGSYSVHLSSGFLIPVIKGMFLSLSLTHCLALSCRLYLYSSVQLLALAHSIQSHVRVAYFSVVDVCNCRVPGS